MLRLNRKAEIQCILASSIAAGNDNVQHLHRVLDNIFGVNHPFGDSSDTDSQIVRGAAGGLVEYIVDRIRELR